MFKSETTAASQQPLLKIFQSLTDKCHLCITWRTSFNETITGPCRNVGHVPHYAPQFTNVLFI